MNKYLKTIYDTLDKIEMYSQACSLLNYDLETICPTKAKEKKGSIISALSNNAYKLRKSQEFIDAHEYLVAHLDELDNEWDKLLIKDLHKGYSKIKNVTSETQKRFSDVYQKAFIDWETAKKAKDYKLFRQSLEAVKDVTIEDIGYWEDHNFKSNYDAVFDEYEEGMTSEDLDKIFGELKPAIVDLLNKIKNSKKVIRTDFMSRTVSDEQQKKIGELVLNTMGFDWSRGAMTTSEHPFTDSPGDDDIRITTHYYPNAFHFSMYSCLHEGGHALFEQNCNKEAVEHHYGNKSMAQHESVSRFYENVLGSSKAFIYGIFDDLKKIIPDVLNDVTPQELYEAVNLIEPSFIRTEADELTYALHIIIRYEIEKMILDGNVNFDDLPKIWNQKYQDYLGITPKDDKEGILQDMHWASGFGYFPTYALGNIYNAMYYQTMLKDVNVAEDLQKKDFSNINRWMIEHVFKDADKLNAKDWIKQITEQEFTAKPFIDYLTKKYSEIYEF